MKKKIHWYPVLTTLAGGLVLVVILIVALSGAGQETPTVPETTRTPPGQIDPAVGDRLMRAETRLATIREQAAAGNRSAAPLIRPHTQDRDPRVRIAAIEALVQLEDDGGILAIRGRAADREVEVRKVAAAALAKMFNDLAANGLRDMIDPSKEREPLVRRAAVEALGEVADERADRLLLRAMEDPEPEVRRATARALVGRQSTDAARGLARALMDRDASVRQAVGEADAKARHRALDRLVEAVDAGADLPARLDAARALAAMGEPGLVTPMLRLVEQLPRTAGRGDGPAQLAALKRIITEAIIDLGEDGLEAAAAAAIDGQAGREAERIAAEVCVAMGERGAAVLSEHILRWRLYPDPEALGIWVEALGRIGHPDAAEALERALQQDIPAVTGLVETARRRIERESGQTLPQWQHRPITVAATGQVDLGRVLPPHTPLTSEWQYVPDDGVVRINLMGGLMQAHRRADVNLNLVRRGGEWKMDFAADAIGFNKRAHAGRIVETRLEGEQGSERLVMSIELAVFDDMWVRGGFARYELAINLEEGTGRFDGTWNERPLRGRLEAVSWPLETVDGFAPIEPGEYPRMLARRDEIDTLRARARTPFGRAVVRAVRSRVAGRRHLHVQPVNWVTTWEPGMDAAIGHGLLAHLFDDAEHGRRAAALMVERTRTEPYGGEHGERWPGPMSLFPFAYDLGHEWLTGDERDRIASQFADTYGRFDPWQGPRGILAVNYTIQGLSGTLALAALHHPGPIGLAEPPEPRPVLAIEPDDPLPSTDQRPVNRLAPGKMMDQWLMVGPFGPEAPPDPLEPIGGLSGARPTAATTMAYRGATFRFVEVPASALRRIDELRTRPDYLAIPGTDAESRTFLYSLLEVTGQSGGVIDLVHPFQRGGARMWINGRRLEQGQLVALDPGRYHVLIEVEGTMVRPSLAPADAQMQQAGYHRQQWFVRMWERALETHEQTGHWQNVPLVMQQSAQGLRAQLLMRLWEDAELRAFDSPLGFPFIYSSWVAGEGLYPDVPLPLEDLADPRKVAQVRNRFLVLAMGMVDDPQRSVLADEFDRRFASNGLSDLGCLELAAALINYPADRLADWPLED